MEGSKTQFLAKARVVVAGALLAGVVAVAGCGGGGGSNKPAVPPPTSAAGNSSAVVGAEATAGLVGPAERAFKTGGQANDQTSKIAPNANHVPKGAHGHAVGAFEDCHGDITPTADNLAQVNAAILCLVNVERNQNGGLPPLASNPQLQQAAEGMAARMVQEQFFSHETPDGKNVVDRVQPTGYIPDNGDWVVGENLAWGSGPLSTPNSIVNGWMNSPGHKANILAPDYKDLGLASAMGSPSPQASGGTTYVNDFGAKSGADSNVTLPPESGGGNTSSDNGQASQSSANGQTNTSANPSSTKTKHKKKKHKKKKHRKRH